MRIEGVSVGAFELDTDATPVLEHQQVEFGACVRRPRPGALGLGEAQHLVEREAFP